MHLCGGDMHLNRLPAGLPALVCARRRRRRSVAEMAYLSVRRRRRCHLVSCRNHMLNAPVRYVWALCGFLHGGPAFTSSTDKCFTPQFSGSWNVEPGWDSMEAVKSEGGWIHVTVLWYRVSEKSRLSLWKSPFQSMFDLYFERTVSKSDMISAICDEFNPNCNVMPRCRI